MNKKEREYIEELHKFMGIQYKYDFIKSLKKEEIEKGYIRIYLPDTVDCIYDELCWGYMNPEDIGKKNGKGILLNFPFNLSGTLFCGSEFDVILEDGCEACYKIPIELAKELSEKARGYKKTKRGKKCLD